MHAQNVTSNFITANFSESVDITKNYSELFLLNPTIFSHLTLFQVYSI